MSIFSESDQIWMQRALTLAANSRETSPNPMVGAVVVSKEGELLGEGWHLRPGQPHAERVAIAAIRSPKLLIGATIYVTLEPCNHHGRTPPCSELLIRSGIRRVVACCTDPNPVVSGRGIATLKNAGLSVDVGLLEEKGRWLNRRFFTLHEKRRPYIILKWAQSADGYIAAFCPPNEQLATGSDRWITEEPARRLVHQWRAEEDAILVGTQTAIVDNPSLTVRLVEGRNPLRVILDRKGRVPMTHSIFDGCAPTLIVGEPRPSLPIDLFAQLSQTDDPLVIALEELRRRSMLSVIIEGGTRLLDSCLEQGLWDELRVFISPHPLKRGYPAPPLLSAPPDSRAAVGNDHLLTWFRPLRIG
jgi:diaminohydroxyphosphoribosylaminopyrimidine deaminase/5-amino-6-(5-phosphoribosylamino)uracil reductase